MPTPIPIPRVDTANRMTGNGFNNVIKSYGGDDYLDAGAGNGTIYGGRGDDVIHGGAGDDYIYGDTVLFAGGRIGRWWLRQRRYRCFGADFVRRLIWVKAVRMLFSGLTAAVWNSKSG